MDRIEEVKKILDNIKVEYPKDHKLSGDEIYENWDKAKLDAVKQICQLFEPKPDEGRLPKDIKDMITHAGVKYIAEEVINPIIEKKVQARIEALIEEIEGMARREANWIKALKAKYTSKGDEE